MVYKHIIWQYPDREFNRFKWWPRCFDREVTGEVRNGLAFQSDFFAGTDWAGLEDVGAFLRQQGVKDGDGSVLCWHDATHPLYLMMDLRQPIRFMHLSIVTETSEESLDNVRNEVKKAIDESGKVRFVVSDLRRVAAEFPPDQKLQMHLRGPDGDLIPPVVPASSRAVFPMNQPAVFRSGGRGRYLVHVLKDRKLVGDVYIPGWPRP
jgi:hypothetical protein